MVASGEGQELTTTGHEGILGGNYSIPWLPKSYVILQYKVRKRVLVERVNEDVTFHPFFHSFPKSVELGLWE